MLNLSTTSFELNKLKNVSKKFFICFNLQPFLLRGKISLLFLLFNTFLLTIFVGVVYAIFRLNLKEILLLLIK